MSGCRAMGEGGVPSQVLETLRTPGPQPAPSLSLCFLTCTMGMMGWLGVRRESESPPWGTSGTPIEAQIIPLCITFPSECQKCGCHLPRDPKMCEVPWDKAQAEERVSSHSRDAVGLRASVWPQLRGPASLGLSCLHLRHRHSRSYLQV